MTQNPRFTELLGIISRLCEPLGIWGDLDGEIAYAVRVTESLREEDIGHVFDLIGCDLPRELRITSDDLDGKITLFLSTLAEKFPYQFLSTLRERIGSIPTAIHLIDGSEDVDREVGRVICELASTQRCLSATERAMLKERCGTIGCRYPFGEAGFHPTWRTTDVILLAQGIYDERAFDRMPILADALQDAGCDNADILTHCRDASLSHARGCWVVDLVLNKE